MDYTNIRQLTAQLYEKISSGTIDSPSWDLIRTAKLAARMYAPLGTRMSLGDYVRLIRTFLDAFKRMEIEGANPEHPITADFNENGMTDLKEQNRLHYDLKVSFL